MIMIIICKQVGAKFTARGGRFRLQRAGTIGLDWRYGLAAIHLPVQTEKVKLTMTAQFASSPAAVLPASLPAIAPLLDELHACLWRQDILPATVLELCRLRLWELHGLAAEEAGAACELPAGKRQALARWDSSEHIDAAERACLAFAEVYAMDVQAITDAQAQAVVAQFGDAGLVLLIEALGQFDGVARLRRLWPAAAEV